MALVEHEVTHISASESSRTYRKSPPLSQEGINIVIDIMSLGVRSLELLSCEVPRGHGEPVFLYPGMGGDDSSLFPLRHYLQMKGYVTHRSHIINTGNIEEKSEILKKRLIETTDKTGTKAALIGHSLGGSEALILANEFPDRISSVVTLGSPVSGNPEETVHPLILQMGKNLIDTANISVSHMHMLEKGLRVPAGINLYCFGSEFDGVINPEGAWHPQAVDFIKVPSSHVGYPFNPDVLLAIVYILGGKWEGSRLQKQLSVKDSVKQIKPVA